MMTTPRTLELAVVWPCTTILLTTIQAAIVQLGWKRRLKQRREALLGREKYIKPTEQVTVTHVCCTYY